MLRAGGQRRGGAGRFARQVVEDHRLADIRAADDGHDQERRPLQLRQQLALEEIEPLPALRRSHAHALRRLAASVSIERASCVMPAAKEENAMLPS